MNECQNIINNSQIQIDLINKQLENNSNAVSDARGVLNTINAKISQLNALLTEAQNYKKIA